MRRADRLFRIVLLLGRGRVMTARNLADELEVSPRTVYRDISDLTLSGVPIDGEAGVGYRLKPGYQLPPLMFDPEELEMLSLGAIIVRAWADEGMAQAAERVLSKVDAVLPERLRWSLNKDMFIAPDFMVSRETVRRMHDLRNAINQRVKVHMKYRREEGEESERVIWPLGLIFWGNKWTLGGWCELRKEFRSFRLDRILSLSPLPMSYPDILGKRFSDFVAYARNSAKKESNDKVQN